MAENKKPEPKAPTIALRPMTINDIEWIRLQRNKPELYRYFRQDAPIIAEVQMRWWRGLNQAKVRLFVVTDPLRKSKDGEAKVGYVGFNPFNHYSLSAEFGIFIIPEEQGAGYGRAALLALLRKGFEEWRLSNIYSDVLMYPGEDRWSFYDGMGFMPYADACQTARYKKNGKMVPSKKFYMTSDRFAELYGNDNTGGVVTPAKGLARPVQEK